MFNGPLVILSILVNLVTPKSIQFNNCKSTYEIKEVSVDPCDDAGSNCPLYRGKNATISITFIPNEDVDHLKAVVHGITKDAMIGKVPFELPNSNACKDSNLQCPLKAGQQYVYRQTLPILSIYPQLTLLIKWELVKQSQITEEQKKIDQSPVCTIIRATIKDHTA